MGLLTGGVEGEEISWLVAALSAPLPSSCHESLSRSVKTAFDAANKVAGVAVSLRVRDDGFFFLFTFVESRKYR